MSTETVAERALYRDLARIMSAMREERYRDVEAAIEARIRTYLKVAPQGAIGLEIAMGWVLPEGADVWPVYTTRFRTVTTNDWPMADAAGGTDAGDAAAGETELLPPAAAQVIAMVPPRTGRRRHGASEAVVLAFPGA